MIRKAKLSLLSEKDDRFKLMNERINSTEKYTGEMCSAFAAYSRKLGRYRDKHDELAKVLKSFSDDEILSENLATGIDSFSKAITFLADFLELEIHRIECKIITELGQYEGICRATRESLKTAMSARDKEVARQKQLVEIKTKFATNSTGTDSELLKLKLEVNKADKEVDEIIDNFEKRRLRDIKTILLNFISIQLKQYTKSLEVLSAAYQDISDINEKKDLQNFKKSLKIKNETGFLNKFRSQSMDSLSKSNLLNTPPKHRNRLSRSTKDLPTSIDEEENLSNIEEDESNEDDETLSSEESNPDGVSTDGENETVSEQKQETNSSLNMKYRR